MTASVLLEPLMGAPPWSPLFVSDGSIFGPEPPWRFDDPACWWGLRVTPWCGAWPSPVGDFVPLAGGVAGRLTWAALQQWVAALNRQGEGELATLAEETMAAHLRPCAAMAWGRWRLTFDRPLVMGVVNVTPDSFSDGGCHGETAAAMAHGLALAAAGADILDVGGESTRPGAAAVTAAVEMERVVPVVAGLSQHLAVPISVDSSKAVVARAALAAGAAMVNDVAALGDENMGAVVAAAGCPVILMHRQGQPASMQQNPTYTQVVAEVYDFLAARMAVAKGMGIERVMVDPGIGFGKSGAHNMALLRHLRLFRGLGAPLLLGVSRKSIVGLLTGEGVASRRDPGSHVLAGLGMQGGAEIIRVHDVAGAVQAAKIVAGWNFFNQ